MLNSISKKLSFSEDLQIHLLALLIDMIITLFVNPYDPLKLERFFTNQTIFWVYLIIIYLLFLLLGAWHNALIEKLRRKEYKKLEELCNLMREGSEILHYVRKNFKNATEKELRIPIKKLDSWHINTYQKYKEINPIMAENWNISEIETRNYADKDYGEISAQYLNIMDSKINKLKRDLNYYGKKIDKQKQK